MELRQFLAVIWKRLWLILLATVLVAGMTYYLSITMTPVYQATTTLHIDVGADPRSDPYSSLVVSERSAKTYVEQMKAPVLLDQVVVSLGLPLTSKELLGMITVEQIRDTQLIRISVEDTIPARAREIANKMAEVFIQQNVAKQEARFEAGKIELDQQIAELEKSIEDTQTAIVSLGDPTDPKNINMPEYVRLELTRLQNRLSTDQTRLIILLKSREDFRLAAARYTDNITIFSPAELPTTPVKPRTMLNTLLGLISGVVLGLSTAFLIEYLDDTLKTAEDVTRELGLTTLGNVSRIRGVKKLSDGLVTRLRHRSPAVEAYRVLRTNMQFSSLENPSGTVLITSPGPKEGKTTTLANLGVVVAQAGRRTILVDTDLRRPTLHQFFALPRGPGLTDLLLQDDPDIEGALLQTEVEGLEVLPSGPIPPNPSELLGSQRMTHLIESLKERAEMVLFDSPPVLAVTDATLLATKVAGVLLVVEAGTTRSETGRRAKEALTKVEANILGVVLNRQKAGRSDYYYYYYYATDERGEGRKRKRSKGEQKVT